MTMDAPCSSLRLRLGEAGVELVGFGCSPAQEALRSLHVLQDVKRHPLHISWVLQARSRMTPALKDEVELFAFWYLDRPLVFQEIWPQDRVGSWAEEVAMLRRAPVEAFAEQLVHAALAYRGLGPGSPWTTSSGARRCRSRRWRGSAPAILRPCRSWTS